MTCEQDGLRVLKLLLNKSHACSFSYGGLVGIMGIISGYIRIMEKKTKLLFRV